MVEKELGNDTKKPNLPGSLAGFKKKFECLNFMFQNEFIITSKLEFTIGDQ